MTEMKKCYLKPETDVVLVEAESILAGTYDPSQPADSVPQDPNHNPWLNP